MADLSHVSFLLTRGFVVFASRINALGRASTVPAASLSFNTRPFVVSRPSSLSFNTEGFVVNRPKRESDQSLTPPLSLTLSESKWPIFCNLCGYSRRVPFGIFERPREPVRRGS